MKILSLSLLLAVLLTGCLPPNSSRTSGGVAVVDLEAIAKRLGRDVAIAQELKTAGTELGTQLVGVQKDLQGQFEKKKQEIGANPNQSQQQSLEELERTLNTQFQQKQQEAQQEIAAKRNALVVHFREEVKPIAMRIAQGRGCSTVLIKNENVVLDTSSSYDITDEVIGEMARASGSHPADTSTSTSASTPASSSGTN